MDDEENLNQQNDSDNEEDGNMDCSEENVVADDDDDVLKAPQKPSNSKRHKTGVIYLSRIPSGMTVTKLAEILSNYGELGKIYLKPRGKLITFRIRCLWINFGAAYIFNNKQIKINLLNLYLFCPGNAANGMT